MQTSGVQNRSTKYLSSSSLSTSVAMVFGHLVATHCTVVTEIPYVTHVTEISVISLPISHCLVGVATAHVLSPSSSSHTTSGRPV